MSGFELNHRLLHPTKTATLAELAELWEEQRLTVRVVGMGWFIQSPSLLNKIRGSLGRVLLQSGSSVILDRQPCNWSDTCAAEPLFGSKPQIKIGPNLVEIAKPYRLKAQKDSEDLLVSISLFGFSKVWGAEVKWALIFALREFVAWNVLSRDHSYFIPRKIQVTEPVVESRSLRMFDIHSDTTTIHFTTPVDAERGNLFDRPQALFERLFLRAAMLARWHDVQLIDPWDQMKPIWSSLTYEFGQPENITTPMLGGHKFRNSINTPSELKIEGDISKCADLLRIGESGGFGRGAVIGFGGFCVRKGL